MKRWECTVCGYIHVGEEPPDECPVCGADKSQFVLLEEPAENVTEKPAPEVAEGQNDTQNIPLLKKLQTAVHSPSIEKIASFLSQYHAHPMMVHIPNGVLPLSLLFSLFALVFQSTSMAVAAKLNMTFVFIAMPIVILTGLLDWIFRFNSKLTRVFKIKLVCAGIVFLFSGILSIWWFIQPDIHLNSSGSSILFVGAYLVDFGASVIAGWYGGKLVFTAQPKKRKKT